MVRRAEGEPVSERVRVGLIGAGSLANKVHYPSLAEFPDVELAAICDLVPEKLERTAARFGIPRTYSSFTEMLDREQVDAVWILMPPHHLYDLVIQCVERGKHVFIEKPPGITYEQARMMADACRRNGVHGMCGFNRRFIPLMQECMRRVRERGKVIQCSATFYKHYLGQKPYYDGAADILTSDAIHAVDTLRWMGGEVQHLASDVARRCSSFDDAFNALLRFEGGATGTLLTNWCVGARRHTFEMHAPGISAFVDPDDRALIYADGKLEPEVLLSREVAGSDQFHHYYGFAAEDRHFVDCIKDGREPLTSLRDAAKTMRLVQQIYAGQIDPAAPSWVGGA